MSEVPFTQDDVESRATHATRATGLMEILKARRKQEDVPVHPVVQDDVESRVTHATHATDVMEILIARRKRELAPPALPAGIPQESLRVTTDQGLSPEQPATVEVLNTITNAVSTGSGPPVRFCLGCDKLFTPSIENRVYCSARCWNTPKAVLMPFG
jgi:hypothetical protein